MLLVHFTAKMPQPMNFICGDVVSIMTLGSVQLILYVQSFVCK